MKKEKVITVFEALDIGLSREGFDISVKENLSLGEVKKRMHGKVPSLQEARDRLLYG